MMTISSVWSGLRGSRLLQVCGIVALGLVFELSYLLWIFFADRGWPVRTAAASMLVGGVSISAVAAALERPANRKWLILGYGVGSYCAAVWRLHNP